MTQEISLLGLSIIEQFQMLAGQIALLPEAEAIEVINRGRALIHEVSPFKDHPVDFVEWVPGSQVEANDYNPNRMGPQERKQLEKSLLENGYAMPVVVINEEVKSEGEGTKTSRKFLKKIVDGYHKSDIGKNSKAVRKQNKGYLPVCHIRPGRWAMTDRMAATIQFNAHGEPSIQGLSDFVLKYVRKGWSDERIAKELVWEPDKVLRLRQQIGLAEVWKDEAFRQAWDMVEVKPLSIVLRGVGIGLSAYADWESHHFVCEKVAENQYGLNIDDQDILKEDEEAYFVTTGEIEGRIVELFPSYQIGSSNWYKDSSGWESDETELQDPVSERA